MPLPTYDKRLCKLREAFVEKEEKNIVFGNQKTWVDVEADEATFDKKDISRDPAFQRLIVKNGETIMWQQWGDVIQRGPSSYFGPAEVDPHAYRAPGPGAIRKTEWKTIAQQERKVILYTDSAKSCKAKVKGVLYDKVVHCKKRVKVTGKFR